ncbi:hypothetical protein DM860_013665 [Cuscuta australis]|uniref:TMEM205-like domain-containing protein n=1 Tax=Cuscuta australis TaxID=267555 RepID=A0A328EEE8_9ASTE|nr:hypothetical protein DM860_013665 [Cuscuta australis]
MMNILALSLILSTLLAAEVWSPPPPENTQDVIVKEGHRVVVVEYDKDHGWNTKISISPRVVPEERTAAEKTEEGGGSGDPDHRWTEKTGAANPRELVCDAFGKCKHKIASALGMAKDAAETVGDVAGKARETAAEKAYGVEEKVEEMKRGAGEMAGEAVYKAYRVEEGARSTVGEGLGKARDKASEIAREAAHAAYMVEEGTRCTIGGAVDVAGEAAGKAYNMVGDGLGKAKHGAVEVAGEAAEKAHDMKEKTRHAVKDGFGKARDAVAEKGHKAASAATNAPKRAYEAEEEAVASVKGQLSAAAERVEEAKEPVKGKIVKVVEEALGMANLAGLATAYGMGVWVTFGSSYVLARALPRQQFGLVQSKIYPTYFKAMAYSIGMALVGQFLMSWPRENEYEKLVGLVNLLLPLVFVLVNLLYLEPRATKVMFERMKLEKEEGRGKDCTTPVAGPTELDRARTEAGPTEGVTTTTAKTKNEMIRLGRRLKKLNSCSSFLNVATLMSLTFYLATLAHRLQSTPPC